MEKVTESGRRALADLMVKSNSPLTKDEAEEVVYIERTYLNKGVINIPETRDYTKQSPMRTAYANLNEDGSITVHGILDKKWTTLQIKRDERELCSQPTQHEDKTVSFCLKPKGHAGKHGPEETR